MTERYEEVRRKLVERGYLQGRIERFVLRDLAVARTSLKAALLGALMLGSLSAAATVVASRPSLGAKDALVLWLYFAALSGVALFALDLIAGIAAAAWAARRGARAGDALRAGLLVAVPVLIYLVAISGGARTGAGLVVDALFLAGATAATALVAWLAGLVSLAGIVRRTGIVPDRKNRSVAIVLAVLAPVALAFFLARAAIASGEARPIAPSTFTAPPRAERLLVLGIDGLDGGLVETLGDRGAVDHLLDLFSRGALFPKHRRPGEPPEIWTTIATGVGPEAHGVRSAGATRLPGIGAPIAGRSGSGALDAAVRFLLPGRTVPTSGASRRVRTLWEMLGLSRPSLTVGWWASWPARGTEGDPESGYVISDRVLAKLLSAGGEDRDTYPASLFTRLAADFPAERAAWRKEFDARFATLPEDARYLAWESFLIDTFAWRTTLRLSGDPVIAASFTYLPGLDILRTRSRGSSAAAAAIETYLRWLDDAVFSDLAARRGERILLVADPGRSAPRDAEGFVAVDGGGATPRCVGPPVSDLDAAPLALRLAGLPASREMPGRLPDRCFDPAGEPAPRIASWGRRGRPVASAESEYDPDMVLRLKSLGYLR